MAFYQLKPKDVTSSFVLSFPLGTAAAGNNTDADSDGITDPAEAIGDAFSLYNGTAANNTLLTNNNQWLDWESANNADQPFMYCNFDLPQLRPTPERGYGFLSTAVEAQRFRVWARADATGGAELRGNIGVSIDGNTVLFNNLTQGTISDANGNGFGGNEWRFQNNAVGIYFDYTWTADPALVDVDATNIHFFIEQTSGGGPGTGNPLRRHLEIGAVEWYAQFNDPLPYAPKTRVYFI